MVFFVVLDALIIHLAISKTNTDFWLYWSASICFWERERECWYEKKKKWKESIILNAVYRCCYCSLPSRCRNKTKWKATRKESDFCALTNKEETRWLCAPNIYVLQLQQLHIQCVFFIVRCMYKCTYMHTLVSNTKCLLSIRAAV